MLAALENTYTLLKDTIVAYDDPDDPAALDRMIKTMRQSLFQVTDAEILSPDYIALALYHLVRFERPETMLQYLAERQLPSWQALKPHLRVHRLAHDFVRSLESRSEDLTLAVFSLFLLQREASQPAFVEAPEESDEMEEGDDE